MEKFTYLISDGLYYKIGESNKPEKRLNNLKTANPNCELICYDKGRTEKQLHDIFKVFKIEREWYKLKFKHIELIKRLLSNEENGRDLTQCANYRAAGKIEKQEVKAELRFGKYKGRKICEMTKPDEIAYLKWFQTWRNVEKDFPVLIRIVNKHLEKYI